MKPNREQKLVDIMFEVAFTAAAHMHGKPNDEIAAWVKEQLRQCGFEIVAVGSSWGLLQN